jgi:hypothetical protein
MSSLLIGNLQREEHIVGQFEVLELAGITGIGLDSRVEIYVISGKIPATLIGKIFQISIQVLIL